jgi:hypothetical protein
VLWKIIFLAENTMNKKYDYNTLLASSTVDFAEAC